MGDPLTHATIIPRPPDRDTTPGYLRGSRFWLPIFPIDFREPEPPMRSRHQLHMFMHMFTTPQRVTTPLARLLPTPRPSRKA